MVSFWDFGLPESDIVLNSEYYCQRWLRGTCLDHGMSTIIRGAMNWAHAVVETVHKWILRCFWLTCCIDLGIYDDLWVFVQYMGSTSTIPNSWPWRCSKMEERLACDLCVLFSIMGRFCSCYSHPPTVRAQLNKTRNMMSKADVHQKQRPAKEQIRRFRPKWWRRGNCRCWWRRYKDIQGERCTGRDFRVSFSERELSSDSQIYNNNALLHNVHLKYYLHIDYASNTKY